MKSAVSMIWPQAPLEGPGGPKVSWLGSTNRHAPVLQWPYAYLSRSSMCFAMLCLAPHVSLGQPCWLRLQTGVASISWTDRQRPRQIHRGGHVQNRIRRRQARRGKIEHSSQAVQPRTDGGLGRQAKACQHRRGRGLVGAHRRRHPKKERCNNIQTSQLHVPRGHTAQGSCRVEQERVTRTVSHSRGVRRRARDRCHRRDGALGFNQTFARDDREGCRLIPCLQEHSPLVVPEA